VEVLKNYFTPYRIIKILNDIEDIYAPEIPSHIARWHYPDSFENWKTNIEDELRKFLAVSSCYVAENISDFFNIDNFAFTCDSSIK